MTEPRTPEQVDERLEAKADKPEDKLPTYQELLDEAVDETFPASDPIAPNAARHPTHAVSTGFDDRDWKLQPTGHPEPHPQEVVAQFDDADAARQARDAVLASDMPTARLDLPADDDRNAPAATLTVVACDEEQRDRALQMVQAAGAAHVELRP
ncbi:MAG TPA: hypothetical protein VFP68_11305 [Burkholderiaceae bacterium]|nr:hypothetical protein [Burkholderiaceae bacterium]